jgi:SAM-dependent methyltransferase
MRSGRSGWLPPVSCSANRGDEMKAVFTSGSYASQPPAASRFADVVVGSFDDFWRDGASGPDAGPRERFRPPIPRAAAWGGRVFRMPFDPRRRNLVDEQMDAIDVDPAELRRALRFIRRINALLRYNASVVRSVAAAIEPLPRDRPTTLLDVATGSGDLMIALAKWSRGSRRTLDQIGLDRHPLTLAEGRATCATVPGVRFIEGDALALPFADASIDVVVSTMFMHHLPDEVAVAALREMRRVARHAVVVADLIRDARAYRWITLFTALASPMVRHDARASVAHAFTIDEARGLASAAGMGDAAIVRTFGHRFALTWRRP